MKTIFWEEKKFMGGSTPLFLGFVQVRLHVGLYVVYLLDWLSIFSREQVLVLRLEDHASNRKYTMHTVFRFLGLGERARSMYNAAR